MQKYVTALALACASCSLGLEVPLDVQISCDSDAECPDGYTCYTSLNTCVRTGGDLTQPAIVDGVVDIPQRLGTRGSALAISFRVDRALASEPRVTVQWAGANAGTRAAAFAAFDAAERRYDYVYTVGDEEPEGFVALAVELLSEDRVPARFDLPRAIELDFLAPAIASGTVSSDITPPAGSLAQSPGAVGLSSMVAIRFAATEALSSVAIDATPSALAFDCGVPLGTFYTCTFTLDAGTAEGGYVLTARLTDLAGNEADAALLEGAPLVLDRTAPASAAVATPGAVVYRRAPYGSAAQNGAVHFDVRGASGAVEPGSTVVVFDDADVATAAELGRVQADASGGFPAAVLVRADRPRVYVTVLDAAGNPSDALPGSPGLQAALVRDVEWIATLAGKVANDTFSNPHSLRERGWFGNNLEQRSALELADDEGVLARVDGASRGVAGAGTWARIDPFNVPGQVAPDLALDTWRGVTWSINQGVPTAWNGNAFETAVVSDPEGDGRPVPSTEGFAAFDDWRGEVVWFSSANNVHETWAWNGLSWRFLTGEGPPSLDGAAMAFDSRRGELILFGGNQQVGGYSTATWVWNGTFWDERDLGGPGGRQDHSMVYDSGRGVVVLYGGQRYSAGACDGVACGGSTCAFADTWEWNGEEWTRACNGTSADCGANEPQVSNGAGMAYDPSRGVSVLFGGPFSCGPNDSPTDFADYVWEWNGTTWARPALTDPQADGSPGGRMTPAVFYDPLRRRVLVTSGENEFASPLTAPYAPCILWSWNGTSFQRLYDKFNAATGNCDRPAPNTNVNSTAMAYDPVRQSLVVLGSGFGGVEDTWEYRLGAWTNFTGGVTDRNNAAMSSTTTGVATFGGNLPSSGNTYADLWGRAGTTWTQLTVAAAGNPGNRNFTSMAYVADDGVLLMAGGAHSAPSAGSPCVDGGTSPGTQCYLADTWGYAQWGTPTCASAGARCWSRLADGTRALGSSLTYDASRGITVAFGGSTNISANGVTREWNNGAWATRSPAQSPSARSFHAGVYDERRTRVVLIGGSSTGCLSGACDDVWEWDGTSWVERAVADIENDGSMSGRARVPAAYVPADGSIYVYGGNIGDVQGNVFHRWDGGFDGRPGHAARFDFSTAGAGGNIAVQRIDVRWTAAGRGFSGPDPRGGVALLAWSNGGWSETARIEAATPGATGDLGAPATLQWCATLTGGAAECDAYDSLATFFAGRNAAVNVGAVSAFTNGRGIGRFETDYVELQVSYREGP